MFYETTRLIIMIDEVSSQQKNEINLLTFKKNKKQQQQLSPT